jgi:hypothetical protein
MPKRSTGASSSFEGIDMTVAQQPSAVDIAIELRRGDLVEVRSAREILATLDDRGFLEDLPFMPEMADFIGQRFQVERRAHRVCDTITYTGSREVPRAVLLDDLRCSGTGHGGCQAECRIVWKEAWLRPVADGEGPARGRETDEGALAELLRRVVVGTRSDDEGVYRCQATDLVEASSLLSKADPRAYLREVSSGNVTSTTFVRVMSRMVSMKARKHLGRLHEPPLRGDVGTSPPKAPPLDLQPGEWVRVKSIEEIRAMLTDRGTNRGLWFDREMLQYCGKEFRVRSRVSRLIDEASGKMIEIGSDCITLDGAVCSGEFSQSRWFCPRAILPYWRECWLERIDAPPPGGR